MKGRELDIHDFGRLCKQRRAYDHEWFVATQEVRLWRSFIEYDQKLHKKEGTWKQAHFNYRVTEDDGTTRQFYMDWESGGPKRSAILVKIEFRKGNAQMRKAYELHDMATEHHGNKYRQWMLGFDLPPRPPDEDDDDDGPGNPVPR